MIVVDSSVWIDFFSARDTPQTRKLHEILQTSHIAIGDLILAEVLQGCPDPKIFNETLNTLLKLHFVVMGGYQLSIETARNYIKLRHLGFTVRKTIDSFIATSCIIYGFELLHNDRDFLPFEKHLGLKCVN